MPFDQATLDKWKAGRPVEDEYSDWRGDHPIIEAHEEVLDLWNYFNRARRLVPEQWCREDRIRRINKLTMRLADEIALAVREAGLLP
jgi:hypothetical protein